MPASRELLKIVCHAVTLERDEAGNLRELTGAAVNLYTLEELHEYYLACRKEIEGFNAAAKPNRATRRARGSGRKAGKS